MKKNNIRMYLVGLALILLIPFISSVMIRQDFISCEETDEYKNGLKLSNGESHVYEWNVTWGGGDHDYSFDMVIDDSDNVYIVGRTRSFGEGNEDVALVKYNNEGVQLWNLTWGGSSWDQVYGVDVDSSNNVYITGGTNSFGDISARDLFLRKYNSSGVLQWNITLGEIGLLEIGKGLVVDSYDNIYVAADIDPTPSPYDDDVILMKYNSNGFQIWNHTWNTPLIERALGMTLDSNENIYITGHTSPPVGVSDAFLIKYDKSGNLKWNISWDFNSMDTEGYDVAVDASGDIYVSGIVDELGAGSILWKLNSSGAHLWNITHFSDIVYGFTGVVIDSAGDVYTTGPLYETETGDIDIVLVKFNSEGTQIWNQTWGGSADEYQYARYSPLLALDSLENIFIAGDTKSFGAGQTDIVLIKFKLDLEEPDIEDPIITLYPDDFTVEIGYTGVNIAWTATDSNPGTYTVELQGSGIVVGPLSWSSGVAVVYNIPDGLVVGDYVYTVNFTDQFRNSVIHTVILTVEDIPDRSPSIGISLIYGYYLYILIGVVSVIIVLLNSKRKQNHNKKLN
ncbi:MAG: hypothetical protein ACFFBH_17245 [Promethearchaeota archaeon]